MERWTAGGSVRGLERSATILGVLLRPAAFSQRALSCCSFRQREKTATWGSPHTSQDKTPGPTPCPLLVESASAGASHRGFKTCYFLVFFRFQNSPAFPTWDSTTFLTGLPLPLASESVICRLDWVLKLPRELFIFIILPSLYTILHCLCRVGWLGFYINT